MKYETLYADFVSLVPEDNDVNKQLETINTVLPTEDAVILSENMIFQLPVA